MPKAGIIENGLSKGSVGIKLNKGDKIILPPKELLPELYIAGGFFSNDQINIQLTEFVIEGKKNNKKIINKKDASNTATNSGDDNVNNKPMSLPPQTIETNAEQINTQKTLMASLKKQQTSEQSNIAEEQPDIFDQVQDEVNNLIMQNNGDYANIYGIHEDDIEQEEEDTTGDDVDFDEPSDSSKKLTIFEGDLPTTETIKNEENESDKDDASSSSSSSSGSENEAEELPKTDTKTKKIRRAVVNFS
ncbi:hypothetical protein [Campylobacter sp. JMF_03 NE3]|uniref:hypothetical protein n=1 Tax=Campylobacter sp. JMF_03 NE3 TaxID=2983831 RepID=UPI0022EA0B7F|nr:hypothetical protein [Campylobacter sp. JMF_03 NE3]MDA3053679.1 hypothetical protein [Campylobacter sp. JMF_03 NE3]